MPVGRRYDRFSESEAVGQRARCHLGFIEIRRHIDIGHGDKIEQRRPLDKLVEEDDVILNAKLLCARR